MSQRPICPTCADPIYRMQRTPGAVAAYPCNHWLPPAVAQRIADQHHATQEQQS